MIVVGIGLIAMASALAYWGWVAAAWRTVALHAIDAYVKVHTPPTPQPDKKPALPPASIMQMAYEHKDDWARESVVARAQELYDELQDWGMVSHQLEQEMGTP